MYFKVSMRHNPESDSSCGYYRLVESYRNEDNRVCHRTLLNIGFLKALSVDQLNLVQRELNRRMMGTGNLFEEQDETVLEHADRYWTELISKKRIDLPEQAAVKRAKLVEVDSLKHKDVREIGSEWLGYQAVEQLGIGSFLRSLGWSEERIQLSLTQIISRAIYPYSELRTTSWIRENSAICELTGYPIEKMSKDKLYENALGLYEVKNQLEGYLSVRTNELFDIQDKLVLYDLTNTYFEGEKRNSKLAKYGRSKEKRNDAKLIVLAMVINPQGFIKYSGMFEGNTSDCSTLPEMIEQLRAKTSEVSSNALVVLDAGIATEDNLKEIKAKGYEYVCVSRSKLKDYKPVQGSCERLIHTKTGTELKAYQVSKDGITDSYLKIKSVGKGAKERGMKTQFESRFEQALAKLKIGLTKKGRLKNFDKVQERIGRIKQRYPSVAKYYQVELEQNEKGVAIRLDYTKDEQAHAQVLENLGVYFIRTSLPIEQEQAVWDVYNTIREIESAFRALKTDLDIRPIYHKNDNATLAHLNLALLAYWVVNTVRFQLKQKKVDIGWQEIVRIGNTQKIITTTGENQNQHLVAVRKCSQPSAKLQIIYHALGYKSQPFVKRKFVVHKSKLNKNYYANPQQDSS